MAESERKYAVTVGRMVRHLKSWHEEDEDSLEGLIDEALKDHPGMKIGEVLELIHNRQHTSEDWDAGHAEDDLSVRPDEIYNVLRLAGARLSQARVEEKNAFNEVEEAVRKGRDAGVPISQISLWTGIARQTVYDILDRMGKAPV